MQSHEIRESFLSFFEERGCRRVPSSSLIPDDPSLLLTAAGMVQFKPVFLGTKKLPFTRATTCQKCVRTTDIDIIGTTGRHHSFFEMLGNFSFGDYFKKEACAWAWDYSTNVLGLDPERIWITIFREDDEAEQVWLDVGIRPERISRLDEADNFWAAGPTGPCGPCSELYYDQGPDVGCGSADCAPGCDCDRFLEYWNLVFIQYDRDEDGVLTPLEAPGIDTGMGLERIASILQGKLSNFDTDILRGLVGVAEGISGVEYGAAEKSDLSLRIIADHARAVAFLIADGVLPSNEGRGYVLRRLIRRAIRHGWLLDIDRAFLTEVVDAVIEEMGGAYPEIVRNKALIDSLVSSEEDRFRSTLRQGLHFLDDELEEVGEGGTLSGTEAFVLHDTYGFPIDLTVECALERGIAVDLDGFEREMEAQRERARAADRKDESWSVYAGVFPELLKRLGSTEFVGYTDDVASAEVVAIVAGGEMVDRVDAGAEADVVLSVSPFYAERGGQVGDHGVIVGGDGGSRFDVRDTVYGAGELIVHRGSMSVGSLTVGDSVGAEIDHARRERTRRNHTVTHLLHWALRLVVGEHVTQAGSFVGPDRLRFDFTHFEALTPEQIDKIERLVNAKIMEDHDVRAYETSLAAAREQGVISLFGEKYGEFVRVLEVGNFSKELCGGTHIGRTTEIGFFKVVTESSIGANLRRIEAVTSYDAYEYALGFERIAKDAAAALKVAPRDLIGRIESLQQKVKELESAAKRRPTTSQVDPASLLAAAHDIGYRAVIAQVEGVSAAEIRGVWDRIRSAGADSTGVAAVLGTVDPESGAPLLLAAGDDAAVAAGFDAGALIRAISGAIQGGGGGKPSMAQAGGKDASGLKEALDRASDELGIGS